MYILDTECMCSVMSDSVMPWTVACQVPLSMEFSRQEYWSGLLFPSWDLPDLGIKTESPVSCIDRRVPNPWTTREALEAMFVHGDKIPASFFCMWISSLPRGPFPLEWPWQPWQKSKSEGLFLDTLFCPTDLYACPYVSTMLF